MSENTAEIPLSPSSALLRRLAALLYDLILLIAVLFVVTALALVPNDGQAIEHPLYLVVVLGVGWLFFDWFWRHGGQTLGMRAWGLTLVDDGGGALTRRRTAIRYALGIVLFGFTLLSVPFDARGRAMHDRLTRTRVIRLQR